jgi:hypothetical protein
MSYVQSDLPIVHDIAGSVRACQPQATPLTAAGMASR